MEIDINQTKVSLVDRYRIYIDGKEKFSASIDLLLWKTEINLYRLGSDRPLYSINKLWNFFSTSYDLKTPDDQIYEFRTESNWSNHFTCQVGSDLFEIFGHKGRKFSVFKNGKQVAWWQKEIVAWFDGDNYKIIADKNCDESLIISFCLIIDDDSTNHIEDAVLNIDLGSLGIFEDKSFDSEWRPQQ